MRVLYVSGMYPLPGIPQNGIFCHEQVKALQKLGIQVDVVVPMPFYKLKGMPSTWNLEGVSIRYIPFFKFPGVFRFEKTGKYLYKSLSKTGIDLSKYDVLHADAPLPTGDALIRLREKYGMPVVIHGHGLDVFLKESYKDHRNCKKIVSVSRRAYSEANAVCAVSRRVLGHIEDGADISGRGFVIYNGVDPHLFGPGRVSTLSDKRNLELLSVGNLIDLKGHDDTIRALKILIDKGYTDVRLKIAGRGEKEEALKQLVSDLGIDDHVSFLGYIPYDEVSALMASSDIFVMPSWYEALGCVYLEAMASEIPAVGCKTTGDGEENGIEEIIDDGVDGYLVNPHDPEQLADKIIAYIESDLSKKKEMSRCAREKVIKSYTWEASARSLIEVYNFVTGKKQ